MKEIKKDEPLPRHTNLDYSECYAKIVLEEMFPERFLDMEIWDKPDLQNEQLNTCVEVTSSIDQKQLEAESLYVKWGYADDSHKKRIEELIAGCEAELNDGILSGKPGYDNFDNICRALENKLVKLSSGQYKAFNNRYLFIYSDIYSDLAMREEALKRMQSISSDFASTFDGIYVLVPGAIYVFDIDNCITYEKKSIAFNKIIRHARQEKW